MSQNHGQKRKKLTLKSLEEQLRRLPDVEAPETLEAKLLAAIPDKKPETTLQGRVKWQPRAWDFGVTAAAAVLIFALMFMVNYGLSVPSQMLLTEFGDRSFYYARWDQNNLPCDQNNTVIGDTNYTNCNGRL
jgi:hypothetical protein